MTDMKTIVVAIDEPTLEHLDRLAADRPRRRTRSALVRVALQEFVERERRRAVEQRETESCGAIARDWNDRPVHSSGSVTRDAERRIRMLDGLAIPMV